MKAHLRESFLGLADEQTVEAFDDMLNLDDKKFAAMAKGMIDKIDNLIESPEFEAEMRNSLKSYKMNIEEERANVARVVKEIDEDDSLSPEKKEFLKKLTAGITERAIALQANPRERIDVKIQKLDDRAIIPTYAHDTDAGADVCALEDTTIEGGETKLVRTGLKFAIPAGYEMQVRPRSGLSLKTGLRIANCIGTVDADYRGEVNVIFTNISSDAYTIHAGDKIAQLLIAPTPMMNFIESAIDDETARGEGGFGSTD